MSTTLTALFSGPAARHRALVGEPEPKAAIVRADLVASPFRIAFAATLGYLLATLMVVGGLLVVTYFGTSFLIERQHANFPAELAAWCAERVGTVEMACHDQPGW